MRTFSLLFLGALLALSPLYAQETPNNEEPSAPLSPNAEEKVEEMEEAQPYIWDYDIGDQEVELFWQGYWKFRFMGGLGWANTNSELVFPSQYPGFAGLPVFEQEPNLLLTLWLNQRFYLETSFVKDFDENTYALGYKGLEGQFIDHIRLANSDLITQGFAGLVPWTPKYNSPGLLVEASTENSRHELLLRLEGSQEEKKLFQGYYQVSEEFLNPGQWIEGRFFLLPNSNIDTGSLKVYQQDGSGSITAGDGSPYRLMETGEYLADLDQGLIEFFQVPSGNIAIYYTKGGSTIGDGGIAESILPSVYTGTKKLDISTAEAFSWSQTDRFSPTTANYASTSQISISGQNCLIIKRPGWFSPFEFKNSYSLSLNLSGESWKNGMELVGNPDKQVLSQYSLYLEKRENLARVYTSQGSIRDLEARYPFYQIEPNLYGLESKGSSDHYSFSLRAYQLGSPGEFSLPDDLVKGSLRVYLNGFLTQAYHMDDKSRIVFNRFIYPNDRIEIHYRREQSDYEGGHLFAYEGNKHQLAPEHSLEWGVMADWILPGGNQEQQEGVISLASQYDYQGEALQSTLHVEGRLINPDTEGLLRLAGMEQELEKIPIYPSALSPSAFDYQTAETLASGDYEFLLEYDYEDSDGDLQDYNYSSPELTGDKGPSAAASASGDPMDTPVMVLPFDLVNTQWTGGSLDIPLYGAQYRDLSRIQEIQVRYRYKSGYTGNPDFAILIGDTGEGEDRNDDGWLDKPDANNYYYQDVPLESSSWQEVTISLSSSDREHLQRSKSITLAIYVNGRAGNSAGTLVVGDIRLRGPSFNGAVYTSSGAPDVGGDIRIWEKPDSSLESAFPSDIDRFHDSNQEQRITRMEWTGLDVGDYWQAQKILQSPLSGDYRYFHFYVRGSTGGDYHMDLQNSQDDGFRITYQPASTDWVKITLDRVEGKVSSTGGTVNLSGWSHNDVNLSRLRVTGEGVLGGFFEMDEIHQEESIYRLESQAQWDLTYQSPLEWSAANGFPLFSGLKVQSQADYSRMEQLNGPGNAENSFHHYVESQANLGPANLGIQVEYGVDDEKISAQGGHSLKLPYFDFPLTYQESYNSASGQDELWYSQNRGIHIKLNPLHTRISMENQSSLKTEERKQQWSHHWTTNLPIQLEWSQKSSFSQSTSTQEEWKQDYWGNWLNSWEDIVVRKDSPLQRESQVQQSLSYRNSWTMAKVNQEFRSTFAFQPQWTVQNSYQSQLLQSYSLSELIDTEEEWGRFQWEYQRNWTWQGERSVENGFQTDWSQYGQGLGELLPLYQEAPLLELFQESYKPQWGDWDDKNLQRYTPSLSLIYSRAPGSHWSSLLIPVRFQYQASRAYQQSLGENSFYNSNWSFQMEHQGLNLFGDYGRQPFFHFYLTDSFQNRWTYNLSSLNQSIPKPQSLDWYNYVAIKGEREWKTHLENELGWNFDQDVFSQATQWGLSWRSKTKDYFKVPLSENIIDSPFYAEQRPSMGFKWTHPWSDQSKQSWELDFDYQWVLHFEGWGDVTSWCSVAHRQEDKNKMTGVEIGIEFLLNLGS